MGKTKKFLLENRKQEFLYYYNQGISDYEMCKHLNVSRSAVRRYRASLGLKDNMGSPLKKYEDIITKLYYENKSDMEIANAIGASHQGVQIVRQRLGLKDNSASRLTENDKFLIDDLYTYNFSVSEIAFYLHKSISSVSLYLKDNNHHTKIEENNVTEFTFSDLEILIGILLGDGNIQKKTNKSPCFSTAHGYKQKEYSYYIVKQLRNLNPKLFFSKGHRLDERTNKTYDSYIVRLPASPVYDILYKMFYKNGHKVLPKECFKYFTDKTLAFLYMDDGCKHGKTYSISTMCFETKELKEFQKFLFSKFEIETTINSRNCLYIRQNSAKKFTDLIEKYVPDCMRYKLHLESL